MIFRALARESSWTRLRTVDFSVHPAACGTMKALDSSSDLVYNMRQLTKNYCIV